MAHKEIAGGVAHKLPADLQSPWPLPPKALAAWESLTPLARNEWICWNVSVKTADTRKNHLKRTITELKEGKRRPCCWMGCPHRTDKKLSPSQKWVLSRR